MNTLTGERLRLTTTDANERTPKWSPDGERLVFVSDRDGNREVYVMDLRGWLAGDREASLTNISQHDAPDWQPAWSPDGRRIAFSSYRDDNWEIYVVNADGTALIRVTDHPESDFAPTWSPDGSKLLFVSRRRGDADLFVLDLGTDELQQLTRSEWDEYEPAWSPDGQWIAFVTQVGDQADVFVMRADGSEAVNLTNLSYADDFQPAWSLDRMRRDGSEVTALTDDASNNQAPSVRPDGAWR